MKIYIKSVCFLLISTALLTDCSKKSDNNTKPVAVSTWTLAGTTFKGNSTTFSGGVLYSVEKDIITLPKINIFFFSHSPAAGTYIISFPNPGAAGQCIIQTSDSGGNLLYSKDGSIKVTYNSGKMIATFGNVQMVKKTDTDNQGNPILNPAGILSGTLVEQ